MKIPSKREFLWLTRASTSGRRKKAVRIAAENPEGIWAAIGLHPQNIDDGSRPDLKKSVRPEDIKESRFDAEMYRELARSSSKVVAIGEIGLDYSRMPKNEIEAAAIRAKQAEIFKQQLDLAAELGLPVVIHTRMAHEDTIKILRDFAGESGKIRGVIHCFTGSANDADRYYDLGLHFGLNGIIFKLDLDQALVKMPLERILLETDCPFLSPLPEVKRNEPRFVRNVAERVAQIRNDSVDAVIEAAAANADKLFGIG